MEGPLSVHLPSPEDYNLALSWPFHMNIPTDVLEHVQSARRKYRVRYQKNYLDSQLDR